MKQTDPFTTYIPKLRLFVLNKTRNIDLTDDIVQETLLRTFQRADSSHINNPLAYLYTVSKTVLFDHWKSQQKIETDEQLETLVDETMYVEDQYLAEEKIKILSDVLKNMPMLRQKVFKMRRLDGMSREDISQELDISVEAVKKHITRAMVEITLCAEEHDWIFDKK